MLTNFNRLQEVFSKVSRQTNDFIEGYVSIKQEDEINLYTYNISIDFNDITPKVIELENKIPRTIERHLFPKTREHMFFRSHITVQHVFTL